MGEADEAPMPGTSGYWQGTPTMEPTLEMQDVGWTPGPVGDAAAPATVPLVRTKSGSGVTQLAAVAAQPADTPESSTQMPVSRSLSIQLPTSSESLDKNYALSGSHYGLGMF